MTLEKLADFQDKFNPLHFYCRLRELGIEKEEAKRWRDIYECGVYGEIIDKLKEMYELP